MKTPVAIRSVANRTPGRLHLILRGLESEPAWAEALEQALGQLPGLQGISASATSSSVLVEYDPEQWDPERLVAAIGHALDRPWRVEPAHPAHACVEPAVQQLVMVGGRIDFTRPLPRPVRYSTWRQADSDPLAWALRVGALCYPQLQPDAASEAFAVAARAFGLPVDDWRQCYQSIGIALTEPVLVSLRRRGSQLLLVARGPVGAILERCAFFQSRQGCHSLDESLRQHLLAQRPASFPTLGLAYRPLLYAQKPLVPLRGWIFCAFAVLNQQSELATLTAR